MKTISNMPFKVNLCLKLQEKIIRVQILFNLYFRNVKLRSNMHYSSNLTILPFLDILKPCYTFFRYEKSDTTVRAILQREYTNDNVITSNFR